MLISLMLLCSAVMTVSGDDAVEARPAAPTEPAAFFGESDAVKKDDGETVSDSEPPVINALSAVVLEESSRRVLYSKNATDKRSIASTTKIMTSLVALENADTEDVVIVSDRAAGIGGSVIGLRSGQKYTLKELLYALLMVSANDAAIAIAEYAGGSVENFAAMMNAKAKAIGAVNSNFVTPHGLDRENQYSTAYDVALITIEALKNPLFAEIVSTSNFHIPGHNLYNTNELLGAYRGVDGVKTGYTGRAGRCLVTTAKRGNMRLIAVVLGSPSRTARANASRALLDFGFDNFSIHRLLSAGDTFAKVPVQRGTDEYVTLKVEQDVELPLSNYEMKHIKRRQYVPQLLKAPVYGGIDTGYVEYSLNGKPIGLSMLKTSQDIRKKTYLDYLENVLQSWSKMMRKGIFAMN